MATDWHRILIRWLRIGGLLAFLLLPMEKKENKGAGKGDEDEVVFLRFGMIWLLTTIHTEPSESAAKQPLLADLLKVPIWKSPMGLASKPDPTQEEDSPLLDPVVPSLKNRKAPWEYGKELYKKRNEAERLFRWEGQSP